jgi:hypothetical protein
MTAPPLVTLMRGYVDQHVILMLSGGIQLAGVIERVADDGLALKLVQAHSVHYIDTVAIFGLEVPASGAAVASSPEEETGEATAAGPEYHDGTRGETL